MSTSIFRSIITVTLIVAFFGIPAIANNRLVNMVPQSRSGETIQDSEPTITVDPNDYNQIAGSAFTWDSLTESPMVTSTAPIFVSTDRGSTWTLAFIVPSMVGASFPTGDITLSFSSTLSGALAHQTSWLYGGILSSTAASRPMTVLRAQDPFSATTMTVLDNQTGNVDQPHTTALTSPTGQDKLYVGFNNGYSCVAPSGRSSTLDISQDAAITAPTMTLVVIEARNTACQDGFAQVAAPHRDGTVYAAFIHDWNGSPRLVVVRDDNWGIGSTPFSSLTDISDNVAGRYVTNTLTLASGTMGQNRLGASNISIAVDPRDSDRVYVAWGDSGGTNSETIHVQRSINRGVDWSGTDLLTATNAMNPQVAINSIGTVGVLYQRLVSGKWETHLVRTTDTDATSFDTPGILLANQSATTPTSTFSPYIGDYASLVSAGRNFIGMFSASNYPDKTNFMSGVKYQREVDWTTHKLYVDAAHTTEVAPSIDPFFFEIGLERIELCNRIPAFCRINFCKLRPELCFPIIIDPWWWLKCPQCVAEIFVRPDDHIKIVTMFDNKGKEVGRFKPLKEPVVVKGMKYNYRLTFKPQKGVSYVLKAETAKGKKIKRDFDPPYTIRMLGGGAIGK